MPLPELGRRLWNQAPQRRLSRWEISLKNIFNARDATNTLARRIKNIRIRLVKKHTQISITELKNKKQVVSQPIHKSDIIQAEAIIYLDDAGTEHLTLLVIHKSHILLVWQGSEAGEPFLISGHVSWATRIHEPLALQASVQHIEVRDVSRRLTHEAKAGEVTCLALGLLILLWAGGVIAGEVKVAEASTRSRHHLLKLLLLLALALVTGVVPVVIVVLVGWVKLLPLGAVGDEVGGVTALKATPQWSPLLLAEPVQGAERPSQQGDLVVRDALLLLIRSYGQRRQSKLQSRWVSSVGVVSHMATNTSTSNKCLTSKWGIMIQMTLPRQLMWF
jgi:hypothetical protein